MIMEENEPQDLTWQAGHQDEPSTSKPEGLCTGEPMTQVQSKDQEAQGPGRADVSESRGRIKTDVPV